MKYFNYLLNSILIKFIIIFNFNCDISYHVSGSTKTSTVHVGGQLTVISYTKLLLYNKTITDSNKSYVIEYTRVQNNEV